MGFNDLKKKSKSGIDELIKKMDDQTKAKDGFKDDRLWRPEQDKSGNGFAIIRFLPTADGEDVPWAKVYNHAFQGPGGWYIENSLTTIGQKDPVGELNNQLWNSGLESDKDLARIRKRKLTYISNVYIVSDPSNPQNEGKVFLYKYGVKIYEKIQEAMKPEFNDEEPINPFDFWKGANFRIKIRKVGGFTNYDKSEFDSQSVLFDDDAKLEKIWKSEYPLLPFLDASNFKSYDELKTRMQEVLGGDVRATAPNAAKTAEDVAEEMVEKKPSLKSKKPVEQDVDDESDALSYFQKLAEN
jgi:gp32 DNA binding protein like